ncbi:hypothetical protein J4146_002948 [Escherichia coli]|nr:hypothetical protein [Escherichia coli]EHH7899125.1 hypothetical protein [Escherichia coli]EHY4250302.1 hypothetical protein [Escherichia coli]ELM6052716.1 hypothetical protein [Escherichia coli]ELW0203743.1 hypothetical protein [Escherichia coli]
MDDSLEIFEEWCADEIGVSAYFIRQMRSKNILGVIEYKRVEINKRYRAWMAAVRAAGVKVKE